MRDLYSHIRTCSQKGPAFSCMLWCYHLEIFDYFISELVLCKWSGTTELTCEPRSLATWQCTPAWGRGVRSGTLVAWCAGACLRQHGTPQGIGFYLPKITWINFVLYFKDVGYIYLPNQWMVIECLLQWSVNKIRFPRLWSSHSSNICVISN